MAIGDPNQLPMGMAGPLNLTPQPSYTPPPVPFGYGQMQGMPALSRNPNYGVPSGIGSLLGGLIMSTRNLIRLIVQILNLE